MSFDYYQILQVSPTATNAEIKTAYRRLAKLFHPDKNPAAEEKFRVIKEAYEILIDDVSRHRYDLKRNYDLAVSQIKKAEPVKKQKTYTFTETELKHRNYYQEHYRPKIKTTHYADKTVGTPAKTNYKELTYLLISIPAAVALLLLLVNLYQQPKKEITNNSVPLSTPEIKTSENPYKTFLGEDVFDTLSEPCIKIKNGTDNDAIIFLRSDKEKVIRHYFLEHNYQLYMQGIPKGNYTLFYYIGKGFSYKLRLRKYILGDFNQAISIDSFAERIQINPAKQDTFLFAIPKENDKKIDTVLLKRIFTKK